MLRYFSLDTEEDKKEEMEGNYNYHTHVIITAKNKHGNKQKPSVLSNKSHKCISFYEVFLCFFNGQILNFRLDYCLLLSAICLSAGDAVICSQILNLHGNAQQP